MLLDVGIVFTIYMGIRFFEKRKGYRKNNNIQAIEEDERLIGAPMEDDMSTETEREQSIHYLKASGVAIVLTLVGRMYPPSRLLGLGAIAYAATPKIQRFEKSIKNRNINAHVLFFIADAMTLYLGYNTIVALAVGMYNTSGFFIARARDYSKKRLLEVVDMHYPNLVWIQVEGIEVEIPIEEVKKDDIIILNAGGIIPVDGLIIDGIAAVDQHFLTGEAQPVEKEKGDKVFASTVVLSGRIVVKVEKSGNETTSAKISQILLNTTKFRTVSQLKGEEWGDRAILPMLAVAGLSVPLIGLSGAIVVLNSHISGIIRVTAPLSTLNYLSIASHKGILVKDGCALERLSEVDTVLFDKTGTLTHETPKVGRIVAMSHHNEADILAFAAAVEGKLNHPIARAILKKAEEVGLVLPEFDDSSYRIGLGVAATINNQKIRVGSARFFELEGIIFPNGMREKIKIAQTDNLSLVLVAVNDRAVGFIEIQPRIRENAADIVVNLRKRGIKHIAIVSGDHQYATEKLAKSLGMDEFFYDILPTEKADIVDRLQKEGRSVCFIGDGINDTIAMKKADVSISLQGASSVATDAAQVILMNGNLFSICELFDVAKDLDFNLKTSFVLEGVRGSFIFFGAFLYHLSILTAVLSTGISILVGVVNAIYPLISMIGEDGKDRDDIK